MKRLCALLIMFCAAGALLVGPSGCGKKDATTTSGGGGSGGGGGGGDAAGSKLAKEVLGTWAKDTVEYTFEEGGDFNYRGGDLTLKGKWKAVNDKSIEFTWTLTKAQVDVLKPIHEVAKKGIDEANAAAKKIAENSPFKVDVPEIPVPPEPKEGDNTWTEPVTVKGESAEISGVKFARALGVSGPFEQQGKFVAEVSGSGQCYFPVPYAKPPRVELKRFAGPIEVKIEDLTPSGFKWKHTGKDKTFGNPEMTFTAKGIPTGADQKPFEQTGNFKATLGAKGEEKFAEAFAGPPHVELSVEIGLHSVMVTEVSGTGFKWKNTGTDKLFPDKNMKYTAKGVKAK